MENDFELFLAKTRKIRWDGLKRNRNNYLFDCYLDEANSSINVCEIENLITKEQADYLRNKYLRRDEWYDRFYKFTNKKEILINGKRINYYSFIKSHEYIECDKAIERIKPLVNMDSIYSLINKIECITENHKTFLKIIINERFKALFN